MAVRRPLVDTSTADGSVHAVSAVRSCSSIHLLMRVQLRLLNDGINRPKYPQILQVMSVLLHTHSNRIHTVH